MVNKLGLEKGSYYAVENPKGQKTYRFVCLGDELTTIYFQPKTKSRKRTRTRFFVETTRVYSSHGWDGQPEEGCYYDIYPHFWLVKVGDYYEPVLDPSGGFYIVPSQDYLVVVDDGTEVRRQSEKYNRSFGIFPLFTEGMEGCRETSKEPSLRRTLTKIA
jgi:hypothetical protein